MVAALLVGRAVPQGRDPDGGRTVLRWAPETQGNARSTPTPPRLRAVSYPRVTSLSGQQADAAYNILEPGMERRASKRSSTLRYISGPSRSRTARSSHS